MANFTPNYKLNKPLKNEKVSIDVLNQNMDILDEKIDIISDKTDEMGDKLTSHTHNYAGSSAPNGAAISALSASDGSDFDFGDLSK